MKHVEQLQTEQTYWTCDDCGKRVDRPGYRGIYKCEACKRDLCRECQVYSPQDGYEDGGDHPSMTCRKCRDVFNESFRDRVDGLKMRQSELDDEETDLWEEWRAHCIGASNNENGQKVSNASQ